MQTLCDVGSRRGFGSGGVPALEPDKRSWRGRVVSLAKGPWGRPLGRAAATLSAVVFLSWLGMRSAQSTSPSPEPAPTLESLVTMAAVPVGSSLASPEPPTAHHDAGPVSSSGAVHSPGVLPDGRVVLNAATAEDLCRLKGIGPARAKKIVALRERLGRFRALRQLLRVRGIGPRTLERLRPHLVLDAPSDAADAG